MDPLIIEGTPKTPAVNFNANGIIEIKGRSVPEDSIEFYQPLVDWLEAYGNKPMLVTEVFVQFEYFNTSSSKCILSVFKKLESIVRSGNKVQVNWYYDSNDEDLLEAGEDYQAIINIPFKIIEINR